MPTSDKDSLSAGTPALRSLLSMQRPIHIVDEAIHKGRQVLVAHHDQVLHHSSPFLLGNRPLSRDQTARSPPATGAGMVRITSMY